MHSENGRFICSTFKNRLCILIFTDVVKRKLENIQCFNFLNFFLPTFSVLPSLLYPPPIFSFLFLSPLSSSHFFLSVSSLYFFRSFLSLLQSVFFPIRFSLSLTHTHTHTHLCLFHYFLSLIYFHPTFFPPSFFLSFSLVFSSFLLPLSPSHLSFFPSHSLHNHRSLSFLPPFFLSLLSLFLVPILSPLYFSLFISLSHFWLLPYPSFMLLSPPLYLSFSLPLTCSYIQNTRATNTFIWWGGHLAWCNGLQTSREFDSHKGLFSSNLVQLR